MRKWIILGVILAAVVGALALALANLNSYLNRNKDWLAVQVENALGRKVTFSEIGVQLFGGFGARIKDLKIAGKYQKRFVLGFPSELGDGPIVSTGVETAVDAQSGFLGSVGCQVRRKRGIGRSFNEAQSKQRCGNTEDHVALGQSSGKIRLREITAGRVTAALDGVESMDAAIGGGMDIGNIG